MQSIKNAITPVIIKVNVENGNSVSTGILLELMNEKFDLVLTCAHCLENVKNVSDISIEVYNEREEKSDKRYFTIEEDEIIDFYRESEKNNIDNDEIENNYNFDVGAILIRKIETIENKTVYVQFKFKPTDDKIYIQGCPGILNKDKYTNVVTLEGRYKEIVDSGKPNVHTIKLDYDLIDTSNSTQQQNIDGISGAALYYEENNKKIIIGVVKESQGRDGKDVPFSAIYALKIENALNKLREDGVIIYDIDDENGKLNIKWIKEEIFQAYDEKKILVIGGSGAGKSSFIKTFANHSDAIDSSGDGQTTRMNIEYNFSIYEKKPRVKIVFLKKEDFLNIRLNNIQLELIQYKYKLLNLEDYNIKAELDIPIKNSMKNLKGLLRIEKYPPKEIDDFINSWDSINFENSDNKRESIIELNNKLIELLYKIKIKIGEFIFTIIFNKIVRKNFIDNLKKAAKEKKLINNEINKFISKINDKPDEKEIDEELINLLFKIDEEEFNIEKDAIEEKEIEKLVKELKGILLESRGFFSYKEFDFINNGDKKISEQIEEIFKNKFSSESLKSIYKYNPTINDEDIEKRKIKEHPIDKLIEEFYGNISEMLLKSVSDNYIKFNKVNYSFEDNLNDISSNDKDKLARCLKVIDGESISSLISTVQIYDSFSDSYAMIMDNLKLKKITFIDTCGLDHIENGELPIDVLNVILREYRDNIKTILYIKKLDSGRPTELEKIIPGIYGVQSNAALYCIFNGIDIFYDINNCKDGVVNWKHESSELPKAVKYIISDEGKKDIMPAMEKKNIRSGRREIIYSVLKKNSIPFCSNLKKKGNEIFKANNKVYIRKIFTSIALEEHLGLELINDDSILKTIQKKEFREKLAKLLEIMFEMASITDWTTSSWGHGHHRTKEANINMIVKENLGYDGTYNDWWSYKFKGAYNKLFSYQNSNFEIEDLFNLEEGCKYIDKVEGIIINLKSVFLGCPKNKDALFHSYNNECKICNERCFRTILLRMYSNENMDEGDRKFAYSLVEKPTKDKFASYLNDICNFKKGFPIIKDDLVNYFIEKLYEIIALENNKNTGRILGINPEIESTYKQLNNIIFEGFLGCTANKNELFDLVIKYLTK